jgi:hypothetical protein
VTRFDVDAIPAVNISYDLRIVHYADSVDRLFDATVEFTNLEQPKAANDALFILIGHDTSISPNMTAFAVQVNNIGEKRSKSFEYIRSIPALSDTHVVQSLADAAAGSKIRGSYK